MPDDLANAEFGNGCLAHDCLKARATSSSIPIAVPASARRWHQAMGLAISRTDPGTGAAADAGAVVIHHHDLLFDLVVLVIVERDQFAILTQALERHHIAATHLEAAATSDAFLLVDRQQIGRLPVAAVTGCI